MVTMSQYFGGGVGFTGSVSKNDRSFDPRVYRVVYIESGFTQSNCFIPTDVSRYRKGTTFYVVNNKGSSINVNNYTGGVISAVQNGYVGEFYLKTPNDSGGVWIFREYQYNNVGRTHGESTRSGDIATVLAANARPTIAAPDCDVWVFENCDDNTDLIYSRQDWSSYDGQSVNFSFEDASLSRLVSRASSITRPVDTRNLLGLFTVVDAAGCPTACVDAGVSDSNCSLFTPEEVILDINSLTSCGCIEFDPGSGSEYSYQSSFDDGTGDWINTEHTLTRVAANTWRKTIANTNPTMQVELWTTGGLCVGTPDFEYDLTVTIELTKTSATTAELIITGTDGGTTFYLFAARLTGITSGECTTMGTFVNESVVSNFDCFVDATTVTSFITDSDIFVCNLGSADVYCPPS